MKRQIVLALVIGLAFCSLMIGQNAGNAAGSDLAEGVYRFYVGYEDLGSHTVQIHPSDDANVGQEEYDVNFGPDPNLWCAPASEGLTGWRTFLKFDLSSIPADVQVQSATLKLFCQTGDGGGASVEARKVTNDAWSEDTITWNNQPPYGELLYTVTDSFSKWWGWNVTTWVRDELSGDKTASFCLKGLDNACVFNAKEEAQNMPYLEITYTTPGPGKSPTTLTVSPASFTLESGQSRTLTATLTSGGSPLVEKAITWTKTAGTLSAGSGMTIYSGQVSVTYTAPTVENQTLVTITASFAGDDQYQSSSGSSSGTITVALDADNDGLPDEWEITYFDNLDQGPGDDPDGDDYTNLQEYQAGTNPNDATSHPGAPENQEGEGAPAGEGFPYLILAAVVAVVVVGAVGAFVWIRRRRVEEGWEPEEE